MRNCASQNTNRQCYAISAKKNKPIRHRRALKLNINNGCTTNLTNYYIKSTKILCVQTSQKTIYL